MYAKSNDDGSHSPIDGILQKTLVYGEKTLMTEFRLKSGSVLPLHAHPHEQTGYLVSGKIRLQIEDQFYECRPGDSWCVSGNAQHGADILEDAVAIEVFSPVREEYLPQSVKR